MLMMLGKELRRFERDMKVVEKVKMPAPAIVDLHSHGGMFLFGKEKVIDRGKDNHPAMPGYHERNYDGRPTAIRA